MKSELNSIPVFVAAAESVSFSQAAAKLHVTRSAVAKTVSRLEERLGVTLFNRTTRSQSLTDEGSLYYEYCRWALAEIKAAEDILDGGKLQANGKLRVSARPLVYRASAIGSGKRTSAADAGNLVQRSAG